MSRLIGDEFGAMIYPKSSSSSAKDEKKAESITGKFDPSALERGAAALRELDTSPNATKAFELTKMAEQTKQQELQKEIEQQQTMRQQAMLQRNQMDAEEKRKTISHQQEQERRTAEYKARLDSELYQSKLEDQQKQIDQQLHMQHEQFLRQEDMRKRNNLELEEEKRRTLQEQARLDREAAIAAMASKLSTEQLQLAKWRLEHGETIQGRPFYDDPKFVKLQPEQAVCRAKTIETCLLEATVRICLLVVEKYHFAFVNAQAEPPSHLLVCSGPVSGREDGDSAALEAWKRFCDMLRETEKILGAIDAPLRDTGDTVQGVAITAPAFSLSADGDMCLGLTPVHVAASFGQTQALDFLKSLGCDLNFKRGDGATALDLAVDQEQAETAAWLEKNGAARARAEAQGRIEQERENVEVRLREMRARMAEERKTRLEQIQAVFAGLGAGTRSLLEDRSKMTVLVGGLTALALGVYGARAATGVAGNLIERPTHTAVASLLESTISTSAMACFTAPGASILSAPRLRARVFKILKRMQFKVQSKTPEGVLHYKAGDVSGRPRGAERNLAGGAAAFAGAAALCSRARDRQLNSKRADSRKQIVVVGGGLAGLNLALRLDQMPWKSRPEVKLLDPKDRYVFLPLLIDYATGVVELEEFAPTYRELLQDTGAPTAALLEKLDGRRRRASEVDWRRRQVSFSLAQAQDAQHEAQSLSFDALVIASGQVGQPEAVSLPGLEEALESGKALRFCSLADAEALRQRLQDSVESVAIVGAGYVGVELAAGLAEVLPEAASAGRIALFGSRFLPGCEEANQKKSAEVLDKLGILRNTGRVVSLDAEGVAWSPSGTEKSELHSCSLVIVTGALASAAEERRGDVLAVCKRIAASSQESIDKGRAAVDSYLRIAPGLFCLGDASGGSPPTGQIAMQQAETTAWNIFAQLSHLPRPTWRRFKPNAMGEFIALGSTEAAGVVQPTQLGNLLPPALPPAIARAVAPTVSSVGQASTAKAAVTGRPASLLRRLAYLYRLPGMHRLKVAQQRLMRPPLVRETSRLTWGRDGLKSLISSRKQGGFLEKIVLEDELTERLQWTTNSLVNAKKNGTPYRHLLLHGPPGTGKTLFARTLARQSGLDYAIMSGGDVGPLGKDAVHELNKLFSWANSSRRGLILFIDEADAFLRTGRGSDTGSMSEEARNVLSAFLHHTGTESDKFVVVLATNIREILDRAVLDRVDENFEFPLPSLEERKRMLAMFMEEHIHTPTKRGKVIEVDAALDESFLDEFWFGLGVAPRCTGAVWAQGRLPSSEKGAGKMAGIDMDNPHLDPVETFSFLRLVSADGHEFFLDNA
eukprot:s2371_g7.t3